MSKHILSKVDGFISRGRESFNVSPDCINVVDGWNDRIDFTGEEELMAYIKESGVPTPLLVRKNKDNELELRDGERRLRAVKRLISEGIYIQSVPVTVAPNNINEVDLYCKSLALNNGKPLSPIEQANSFKRLRAWGLSRQEIANKSGVSLSTVRNRLELSNAVPELKKAVNNNDVSIKDAQSIISTSDGEVKKQSEGLKKVKESPKKRKVIIHYKLSDYCIKIDCDCDCTECIYSAKDIIDWSEKEGLTITKETWK